MEEAEEPYSVFYYDAYILNFFLGGGLVLGSVFFLQKKVSTSGDAYCIATSTLDYYYSATKKNIFSYIISIGALK